MIERILFHNIDGVETELRILFKKPYEADCDWLCVCSISGEKLDKTIKFYGIDSYQALINTAASAFAWIKATEYYKSGDIYTESDRSLDIEK